MNENIKNMRELMIQTLIEIQKRTKVNNKIWRWYEYIFMNHDNLREYLEKMNDQELFKTYNKIYGKALYNNIVVF